MIAIYEMCFSAIFLQLIISIGGDTNVTKEPQITGAIYIQDETGALTLLKAKTKLVLLNGTYYDQNNATVNKPLQENGTFVVSHCGLVIERVNAPAPIIREDNDEEVSNDAKEKGYEGPVDVTIPKEVSQHSVQTFVEKDGRYVEEKSGQEVDPLKLTKGGIFVSSDNGRTLKKVASDGRPCLSKEDQVEIELLEKWRNWGRQRHPEVVRLFDLIKKKNLLSFDD